ncbi:glycosyltransferase family 9 protein [Acidihalobacter prosperus]
MKLSKLFKIYIKDNFLLLIRYAGYPIVLGINIWLRKNKLFILYRLHGSAIGDTLVMTGVARCIAEELGYQLIIYVKQNEDIFANNPHIKFCQSYENMGRLKRTLVKNGLDILRGSNIAKFYPQIRAPEKYYYDNPKNLIIINSLHILGLRYNDLHTEITFSENERKKLREKLALPPVYAVVKPTGKTSVTTKKEWGIKKFQAVINQFPEITWIQPGTLDDPILDNVIDLRGKTNLRELFYLIENAKLTFTIEGLYNHIAAAFESPSFVVHSGFLHPNLTTYTNTIPIVQNSMPTCSPCFQDGHKDCPMTTKLCMEKLEPEMAVAEIRQFLTQSASSGCLN